MPVPHGRDLAAYLAMLAIGPLAIAAGITRSETMVGVAVVAIGLTGLLMAGLGKPDRAWGLTERLLHRLPDPAWRAVMAVLGVAIVALGAAAIVD